jgi:DNA-directed DNA polymerase III PolC
MIHLHTHSHFSFLEGIPSPDELVAAAAADGMPALALSDHRWLTGAVRFYKRCLAEQIQPILGLEIDTALPVDFGPARKEGALRPGTALPAAGQLVLLAMNQTGWANLCRISSAIQASSGDPNLGIFPFEELKSAADGLICLTGGRAGFPYRWLQLGDAISQPDRWINSWLKLLDDRFPGRVYLELQQLPGQESLTADLAREAERAGFPAAAAQPLYYLKPEDAGLQRLVTAIRLNTRLSELPPEAAAPPGSHFLSQQELLGKFQGYSQAVENTHRIADLCTLVLPLGRQHYPAYPAPPESPPNSNSLDLKAGRERIIAGSEKPQDRSLLRVRAYQGAEKLYGQLSPSLVARLERELAAIEGYGYAPLFLIVQDILDFARQRGIPFSSRGSAASSLVAHCLGITSPDPIRLNLYFERFLNPARATPPDIDTDLCSQRRDEVIQYVYRRYGETRVAMVGTINRFRRRSALRETAKALGFDPAAVKRLTELLPYRWSGPWSSSEEDPFAAIRRQMGDPATLACLEAARRVIGLPRHLSIHPGGIVIAPGELVELAPTLLAPKGIRITQFDLDAIEELGLVKIDLLGIRGLSVLGEVSRQVHAGQPEDYSSASAVLESIPLDDPLTADLIMNGRTIGCFQIESPGMRATLKEIQAKSIDDVMVALALYRPGPLTGGLKNEFVTRFRARQGSGAGYEHLHPALGPLLEDTYGVILYQEQVLRIAHELAGLPLEDADLLRRAMSHFDPGKQMEKLQARFISGACQQTGMAEEVAHNVWELMAAFAGYGFPKAHAASYAQIAWRAAWCKAHYPALFMAAVLANWGGYYPQRVYMTEARRVGLALRPPHVNEAGREFSTRMLNGEAVLWMGLDQVRDLTRQTQRKIIQKRPFSSLSDFLVRVDPRPQEAVNLAQIGALEGFGSIPVLLAEIERGWQGGQMPLFPFDPDSQDLRDEDWPLPQIVAAQEDILGVWVSAHPLELAADKLEKAGAISSLEATSRVGERVRLAGMRLSTPRRREMDGYTEYEMALEDLEGLMDIRFGGTLYRRQRRELEGRGPFVIEGVVSLDADRVEPYLRAERIWPVQ